MSDSPTPQERHVYTALKQVFRGAKSKIRRPNKIREIIEKHSGNPDVKHLIGLFGIDNVVNTARILLELKMFESIEQAKAYFAQEKWVRTRAGSTPKSSIFDSAQPPRDVSSIVAPSEGHSTTCTPQNANTIVPSNSAPLGSSEQTPKPHPQPVLGPKKTIQNAETLVSSQGFISLPYVIQHHVMFKIQTLLEEACYHFGQHHLKETLEKKNWTCAEEIELNKWAPIIKANEAKFSVESRARLVKPLSAILASVTQIRHTAVHRLSISVEQVQEFIMDSKCLLKLLQNTECLNNLIRLEDETNLWIGELKHHRQVTQDALAEEIKHIKTLRAELNDIELEAIQMVIEKQKEFARSLALRFNNNDVPKALALENCGNKENQTICSSQVDADGTTRGENSLNNLVEDEEVIDPIDPLLMAQ